MQTTDDSSLINSTQNITQNSFSKKSHILEEDKTILNPKRPTLSTQVKREIHRNQEQEEPNRPLKSNNFVRDATQKIHLTKP
jgi:hypothetical protein